MTLPRIRCAMKGKILWVVDISMLVFLWFITFFFVTLWQHVMHIV
jgi:hypothetical protein